jgi:hypothetical protein
MSATPVLYLVRPGTRRGQLAVEQVWTQEGTAPLVAGYSHLVPIADRERLKLIAIDRDTQASTAFEVQSGDPWITPVQSQLGLEGPFDLVEPFVLGNVPHLLTYASEPGQFAFYPIANDLSSQPPYRYFRRRGPAASNGFDVTTPMDVGGAMYYLCYGSESGRVLIYSLAVTTTSPRDAAPLVSAPVWIHQWARRWVRFAFFQLGGGNFFLKTNVGRLNVNIDHVLDNPADGTVEVGTELDLEDALDLDIVRPFYLEGSEPYFLTYKKDGTTTFNRFHSDCHGWTTEARLASVSEATQIVPLQVGDACYVLFY